MHRRAHTACVAEHAQVTLDLGGKAGRLFRIVRQFAGRPSTEDTLQTIEIGSRLTDGSGEQPTKSLVRLVPQPKLSLTRPAKWSEVSSIELTSIASENTKSF